MGGPEKVRYRILLSRVTLTIVACLWESIPGVEQEQMEIYGSLRQHILAEVVQEP